MERFEFNSKSGPNSNRKSGQTRRGAIELYPWEWPMRTLLSLDIRGPAGAFRGGAIIDKDTAGRLGAALLKWAGPGVIQAGKGFVPRFVGDEPDES